MARPKGHHDKPSQPQTAPSKFIPGMVAGVILGVAMTLAFQFLGSAQSTGFPASQSSGTTSARATTPPIPAAPPPPEVAAGPPLAAPLTSLAASPPATGVPPQPPSAPAPASTFSQSQIATAERISLYETKRLLDAGEALVIDVRGAGSYEAGHIPGAVQIALGQLQQETPRLPLNKKLITVCA